MKLLEFVGFSFKLRVQNWIRREIVDDDPYDDETFFPNQNQPDEADVGRSLSATPALQLATPAERRGALIAQCIASAYRKN